MSRHRFVRNLTDDDYYDVDDDDYYDDEPSSKSQQSSHIKGAVTGRGNTNRGTPITGRGTITATPAPTPKKIYTNPANSLSTAPPKNTPKAPSEGGITLERNVKAQLVLDVDQREKQQTLISMGFTPEQASSALAANNWNVEQALEHILLVSPPPAHSSRDKQHTNQQRIHTKSKHMLPPPGFGPPPPDFIDYTDKVLPTPSGVGSSPSDLRQISALNMKSSSSSHVSSHTNTCLTPSKTPPHPVSIEPPVTTTLKESKPDTVTKVYTASSKSTTSSTRKNPQLLESFAAEKSRLSMVILGHVDAGKSTLMGQVLLQLGYIEKRTINKYRKQAADIGKASFALAWVMDEDESERERGVTMDIATKTIVTPKHVVTVLDSPGHSDFIPAMITGAAAADVAILVIAATPGEFEAGFRTGSMTGVSGGQTREHIILARGLGVSQMIVAVNKLDSAQPVWSQARFYEIQDKLKPFLQSHGFLMKRVHFVPVSGLMGINITVSPSVPPKSQEEGYAPELAQWYTGPTLMEAIDAFEPAKRDFEKPFRFIISDVYMEGKSVIVQGRVVQGFISVGDKVLILPIGDESVIHRMEPGSMGSPSSSISSSPNSTLDRSQIALAGDCVDLVMNHMDSTRIFPGNIITHVDSDPKVLLSYTFQGKIVVMDEIAVPIIQGAEVLLYMHNIDIPAVITKLISSSTRKDSEEIQRPRVLIGGSTASVEIRVREKICVETYQDCRALGRFALRREGDTIAVGIVEKIK